MIIGEERCPGVYGKWAHANQCRTDLEGALGCLIYCLSTSLGKKKKKTARGKRRGAKKREGRAEHKSFGARGILQRREHGRHVQPGVLCSPLSSPSLSVLLSRARCGWQLEKIGAAEHPPSVRAAKIPPDEEGRVRFRSWRAKGGREE